MFGLGIIWALISRGFGLIPSKLKMALVAGLVALALWGGLKYYKHKYNVERSRGDALQTQIDYGKTVDQIDEETKKKMEKTHGQNHKQILDRLNSGD